MTELKKKITYSKLFGIMDYKNSFLIVCNSDKDSKIQTFQNFVGYEIFYLSQILPL